MRNLEFKITVDSLILKGWSHWKRADQDHIQKTATHNGVVWFSENDGLNTMTFKGEPDELFLFMYDLAYTYDIEMI